MKTELRSLLDKNANVEGINFTQITGLRLAKMSAPSMKFSTVYNPSLCVIAQGKKQIFLSDEMHTYSSSEFLAVSVGLPITGQVVEASKDKPYLSLQIDLDPRQISELLIYGEVRNIPSETRRGLIVGKMDKALMEAIIRLMRPKT